MANSKRKKRPAPARPQTQQRSTATRDQKRQEFSGGGRRSPLTWIAPLVVLAAIVAIAAVVIAGAHKSTSAQAAQVTPSTGTGASGQAADVSIPVSQVNDGKLHMYSTKVDGTTVMYFVIKAPDGTLRTAFNACDVCYPYKKGYRQVGNAVQCNNCGRVFPASQIDVQRGGCNPGPIDAKVVGKQLVIPGAQLQGGVRFFQG